MEVIRIKKILARNWPIGICLHCVRTLSWFVPTMSTLTFNQTLNTKSPKIKKHIIQKRTMDSLWPLSFTTAQRSEIYVPFFRPVAVGNGPDEKLVKPNSVHWAVVTLLILYFLLRFFAKEPCHCLLVLQYGTTRWSSFVETVGYWLLNHVIYLKLRRK